MNLANRLEENAPPGRILVSDPTATGLTDRFEFGPPETLDLKGKGPTPVRVLLGHSSNGPTTSMPRVSEVEQPTRGARRELPSRLHRSSSASRPGLGHRPRDVCRPGGVHEPRRGWNAAVRRSGTIVVGVSGAFAENQIVAEMYAQVLEHAGYQVERQLDLRSRETSQSALESGQIDVKPGVPVVAPALPRPGCGGVPRRRRRRPAQRRLLRPQGMRCSPRRRPRTPTSSWRTRRRRSGST